MPNYNEINSPIENQSLVFDFNGVTISVRQYLPFQEKLDLISDIINSSGDDQGFYNSAKLGFFEDMKMMQAYTDIEFDDGVDSMQVYDTLCAGDFFTKMYELIPDTEINFIINNVGKTIDNIYKYRNSAYGILDALKTDYSDLDLDISQLTEKMEKGENIEFLKEVIDKLG